MGAALEDISNLAIPLHVAEDGAEGDQLYLQVLHRLFSPELQDLVLSCVRHELVDGTLTLFR
jgi:hypothetical protein